MGVTGLSDLKNRLREHLRRLRTRPASNVVIPPIQPAGGGVAEDAVITALERAGTLRRGRPAERGDWRRSRPRVEADVVAAVLADREAGR